MLFVIAKDMANEKFIRNEIKFAIKNNKLTSKLIYFDAIENHFDIQIGKRSKKKFIEFRTDNKPINADAH